MRFIMSIYTKLFFIIISTCMLSACSFFSPVTMEAQTKYVLNTVPSVPSKKTHKITLLVQAPETQQTYNTTLMAYTIKPHQVAYFSKNQWAEKPSQMFQPLLVRTLQKTHFFHAIVTPLMPGHSDYVLSTQILELLQDFTQYPAMLRLTVNVQLTRSSTNQVIASQLFTEQQPMVYRAPYSGVIAANRATENILGKITLFCLRHSR